MGPERRDETDSSLQGLCYDLVTTSGADTGRTESRVGGNVYPGNKDCDNCSPFELEAL